MARNRNAKIFAGTLTTLAFLLVAGCATPDESTGDDIDNGATTAEYVLIDQRPYECHDTVNVDGICDDYELDEGYTGAGATESYTSSGDSVTINGNVYRCEDVMQVDVDVTDNVDDVGTCEMYKLDE